MNEEQIKELTETTARSKSNTYRLDKLEEQTRLLHDLNKNVALIAQQTTTTTQDVKALKDAMAEIKPKPRKLIDKTKEHALSILVSLTLGAIMASIFVLK